MGFTRNPAIWIGAVSSILLAVLLELAIPGLTPLQIATALVPVIATILVRYFVTPVAAPVLAVNTPVTAPGGDTANPTLIVTAVNPAIGLGSGVLVAGRPDTGLRT